LTPENSEAPRENRAGSLVDRLDGLRARVEGRLAAGTVPSRGVGGGGAFERVEAPAKVSSPELASLAAKYLNMTEQELQEAVEWDTEPVLKDIYSLAASVLAQAEGTPRK
jgi:hypothetical protein